MATHRPREGAATNDEIQWGVGNVMKGAVVLPSQIQRFSAEPVLKILGRSDGTFSREFVSGTWLSTERHWLLVFKEVWYSDS